ncbi:hypothetical protein AmDm5_1764 [Acetobacter malorum]|nr:hypothetical protein AmDm5_1764 [Acetobacter malorum]
MKGAVPAQGPLFFCTVIRGAEAAFPLICLSGWHTLPA